jgi:hypothetical protein
MLTVFLNNTDPCKYFVVKNRDIFQSGQALIAASSLLIGKINNNARREKSLFL